MNDDLITRAKGYAEGGVGYVHEMVAALVAQLEVARADADRLAEDADVLAAGLAQVESNDEGFMDQVHIALTAHERDRRLHDEAVAQR